MLIYGDLKRRERADDLCQAIAARLHAIECRPAGLERHAALVGILIALGELAQGLADFEFEGRGADDFSPMHRAAGGILMDAARLVSQSWERGFAGDLRVPKRAFARLRQMERPLTLSIREPEGYAFYAVYPESYIEAARRSGLGKSTSVTGIRSIGTSLSAAVSAAIGAATPATVRPTGHPFRRQIAIGAQLRQQFLRDTITDFAIVDEGPGLSGSSFGSMADWLEEHATGERHIHFFPGHKGDLGPEACGRHRDRWATSPRHVVGMDELLLETANPRHQLASWLSDLVGPLVRPIEDFSGGAWRRAFPGGCNGWPPADHRFERRKFLAHTGDGAWLVKFAGLGDIGEGKLVRARILAEAGFTPPVAGLRHGFLVQKWVPAPIVAEGFERAEFISHLGRYLAFRARCLPPPAAAGASLSKLSGMALANTEEGLGAAAVRGLKRCIADAWRYESLVVPVDTDNRLHAWEWLAAGEHRFLKTDAVDHSAGHDLVGAQDMAWDIAGAVIEFGLSPREAATLRAAIADGCNRAVSTELQAIFEIFYLAFQLGLWTSARQLAPAVEIPRLEAAASRYAMLLRQRITGSGG